MTATMPTRLRGTPERIFISVDESTGRSTLSFAPADIGDPVPYEDDKTGAAALTTARAIAASHPGCTIVGQHFHASASARGRARQRSRPRR
jgi:hypothetical protein